MKPNNIETARDFTILFQLQNPNSKISDLMVAYHNYLTAPDSEGEKNINDVEQELIYHFNQFGSFRNKQDITDEFRRNAGYCYDLIIDSIKAIVKEHIFAAQSRPELTDEEIIKEAGNIIAWKHRGTIIDYFTLGAKWARTKMTGK